MSAIDRLTESEYARLNEAVDSDLPRTNVGEVALAIVNERLKLIEDLLDTDFDCITATQDGLQPHTAVPKKWLRRAIARAATPGQASK